MRLSGTNTASCSATVRRLSSRWAAGALVMLVLALLTVWHPPVSAQAAQPECRPIGGPAYLGNHDPAKTSVVVFIHGVLSNALEAWSRSSNHSWPCLLRAEPIFDNSNIYLYAYDTSVLGTSPSIEKVAGQLLKDLQNERVLSHAHVTFVAHSMGGLVLSRMLLQMQSGTSHRSQLERIKLVLFYGTPATGADIANLASLVSDNVQFEEMRSGGSQQALIDRWLSVSWPFPWYCIAEGKRTGWAWLIGTLVVPRESATALCRGRPAGIEVLEQFDHLTMVKPASLQDTPHRYFNRNFVSCVGAAIPRGEPPSEAGTPDGQLMLRTLHALRISLSDDSEAGRAAALSAVQSALSDAWTDSYVIPSNPSRPSLVPGTFDRLGNRPFAIEFLKLFQPRPSDLAPAWVGRVATLERYVADGQLIELRRVWTSAGLVNESDVVVALEPRTGGDQVFIIGGVQPSVVNDRQARIRGLLIVPAPPGTCD